MCRYWREIIRIRARQGLALRGSIEEGSNFIQQLMPEGEVDIQIEKWLKKKSGKYTRPETQNECLQFMSLTILQEISKNIHNSVYYTIIARFKSRGWINLQRCTKIQTSEPKYKGHFVSVHGKHITRCSLQDSFEFHGNPILPGEVKSILDFHWNHHNISHLFYRYREIQTSISL